MPKHNVIEPYSDGVGGTMYDYVIHFAESKTYKQMALMIP